MELIVERAREEIQYNHWEIWFTGSDKWKWQYNRNTSANTLSKLHRLDGNESGKGKVKVKTLRRRQSEIQNTELKI